MSNKIINTNNINPNTENVEHTAKGNDDVFTQVFSNLGDHNGFYVGPYHICDLPIVVIDNGLHIYSDVKAMNNDGLFKETHHEIVRASDGSKPDLDLSVTNLVAFQWLAIIFILLVFRIISKKNKLETKKAPKGFFANAAERIIIYIRDEVVIPNLPNKQIANSLMFYFIATFIFILVVNLTGLLPGAHTATSAIPVTAALAIIAFFVINGAAIKYSGIGHWLKHLLGGAPAFLAPIMIPIELLSLFIKPFSLTIRLFANMTAGHIVLFALLGLLFFFNNVVLASAIVPFSIFIYLLELLVAFIQAFVFTMLVTIYVGQSIGEHAEEHEQGVH